MESRGYQVYAVELDETVEDFNGYKNHKILIDGKEILCSGIEFFAHAPPWVKGEKIGIAVKSKGDQNVLA